MCACLHVSFQCCKNSNIHVIYCKQAVTNMEKKHAMVPFQVLTEFWALGLDTEANSSDKAPTDGHFILVKRCIT